ncbi:MAG: hypothetical protein GY805_03085, partial [Chloroflexi bacterium]|nr:hypothetical protein [Chloroflexota bacterium]
TVVNAHLPRSTTSIIEKKRPSSPPQILPENRTGTSAAAMSIGEREGERPFASSV